VPSDVPAELHLNRPWYTGRLFTTQRFERRQKIDQCPDAKASKRERPANGQASHTAGTLVDFGVAQAVECPSFYFEVFDWD